ncbi:hypothetical protein Nmel_015985 [Mimus melanotis]
MSRSGENRNDIQLWASLGGPSKSWGPHANPDDLKQCWLVLGRLRWPHDYLSDPMEDQVSGSRLRLLQVTAADSGEYVCRVTSGGTTKETSIMVAIQPSSASTYPIGVTPPVRIESSSSSVAEGQTLDLNCIVTGQGQATVTWYKRGGSLPAKHQVSGTRLRIPQVTAADSGEYVCRVTSGSVTHETSLIVTIQTGTGSSYGTGTAVGVTPPVRIETSSAAVTEGQTLDLNCMVAGQGHPHVTWYRRGGALPPNSQVSGTRLRLAQVAVADSGEYVCRVTLGTVTQEASVIVTVPTSADTYYTSGISQPLRIESLSSAIAEGQTLDLNCVVAGSGPTTVTWYKRGGSLPVGHQVSGTRLRIPQVTAADSGEYVCRVTSGGVTQETSLIVTIDDGDNPSHCECHPLGDRFLLVSGTTGAIDPQPCPCSYQHQSTHPH